MTIASDLLQRHIQTLVDDHTKWQTLIAEDIVGELAYAPFPSKIFSSHAAPDWASLTGEGQPWSSFIAMYSIRSPLNLIRYCSRITG
jgi:hypothetical protein